MCGRYGLFHDGSEIADLFGAQIAQLESALPKPRYNIAPTQEAPILVPGDGEGRVFLTARWGLIPHWVKDPSTFKSTLVNARAESAHEKPSFRDALKSSRCVVPASGFYEWREGEGKEPKRPYLIRRRDGAPLALAGLFAEVEDREPEASFTILTTRPNALTALVHDRQPVVLPFAAIDAWFDPALRDPAELADLLEPNDPAEMEAVPISTEVNSPGFDEPSLVEPTGEPLRIDA